jgi:hypothetical protein
MVYLTILVSNDNELITYSSYCRGRARKIVTDLVMPELFKVKFYTLAKEGPIKVSYSDNSGLLIDNTLSHNTTSEIMETYNVTNPIGSEPIRLSPV